MIPRVDILIVSYALDAVWLSYCLRSIRRWATGFGAVNVVYPERDDAVMRPRVMEYGGTPVPYDEPIGPLGHLAQNIVKCKADLYCQANHILHVDSDCIFTRETSVSEYFHDGLPILLERTWENSKDAVCWREPVTRALGFTPQYETMARLPIIHNRLAYSLTRTHVAGIVGMDFDRYVLSQKATFPYGFCEFNTIGAVALQWLSEYYHFVEVGGRLPYPESPVRQLWSHQVVTPELTQWLEEATTVGTTRDPPPVRGRRQ